MARNAFTVGRAIFVRLAFSIHGLMAVWRCYQVTLNPLWWIFATGNVLLIAETAITLKTNRGKEWKWFCPSVMIYLVTVVPPVWVLELNEIEHKRILKFGAQGNFTRGNMSLQETSQRMRIGRFVVDLNVLNEPLKVIAMDNNQWLKFLEQGLLLLLILGRWILPKGKLTHDQLSQLLLVYIGTAADIVEFFEAFNEEAIVDVFYLGYAILAIWSWSLLQFAMVLTAQRKHSTRMVTMKVPTFTAGFGNPGKFICCTPEVYGIMISMLMQDAPYLIFRLLLIFYYGVHSYSNFFFTAKNTIVISLLMYRLLIVQIERKKEHEKSKVQYYYVRDGAFNFGKSMSTPHLNEMFTDVNTTSERQTVNETDDEEDEKSNLQTPLILYSPILVRKAPHASLESLNVRITPHLERIRQFFGRKSISSTPKSKHNSISLASTPKHHTAENTPRISPLRELTNPPRLSLGLSEKPCLIRTEVPDYAGENGCIHAYPRPTLYSVIKESSL